MVLELLEIVGDTFVRKSSEFYFGLVVLTLLTCSESHASIRAPGDPWDNLLDRDERSAIVIARVVDTDWSSLYWENGRRFSQQKTKLAVVEHLAGDVPDSLVVFNNNTFTDDGVGRFWISTTTGSQWVLPGSLIVVGVFELLIYDENGEEELIWKVGLVRYLGSPEYNDHSELLLPKWNVDRDYLSSLVYPMSYDELIAAVSWEEPHTVESNLAAVRDVCSAWLKK